MSTPAPTIHRSASRNAGGDQPIRVRGVKAGFVFAVAGLTSVVLVGGVPGSPLAVALPSGVRPLGVFRWIGRVLHASALSPFLFSLVAMVAVLAAVVGFLLLLHDCWNGRVTVRSIVVAAIVFHAIAVLMPLLLSHDVYSYVVYGRIASIHHANPYLAPPSRFPTDPAVRLVSTEWRDVTSLYGPAFVQLSALLTRMIRSPGGLITAFKLLSAVASLATMLVVIRVARRVLPERTAFAAALIGVNPLVVFDTVGAGHMDAMVALSLAVSMWLLCWRGDVLQAGSGRELLVAGALTLGALIKPPFWICLALFLAIAIHRRTGAERWRQVAALLIVVGGLVFVFAHPFLQTTDPTLGLASVAKYQNELTPTVFLGVVLPLMVGLQSIGSVVLGLVKAGLSLLLLAGLALLVRSLFRRGRELPFLALGASWGYALLLLLLVAPIAWPWYVMWLLPLAWMLPKGPRTTAIVLSSVYSAWAVIGEWDRFRPLYGALRAIGLLVIAPLLLWLLVRLVRDVIRRVREGTPLEVELP